MNNFSDQLGRDLRLQKKPERVISLVPSLTELMVDLELEDLLVGITKFCVHPEHIRKKKVVVGGTKKIHIARVKQLEPDLILCNKEENTYEMVQELEKIATVHVSDVKDFRSTLDLIAQYGEIFEVPEKASALGSKITVSMSEFQEFMKDKPMRRVAYVIWKEPWMVAGRETFINYLLKLNKFENPFTEENSRYPEIDLKSLKESNIDLVLLSTEPFPFKEVHQKELSKLLPSQRIEIVDGEFFSWYGSRLLSAFTYFRSLQTQLFSF